MSACPDCTINNGSALQTPDFTCSRDGLDYDDETFYRTHERRAGSHTNPQRKRRLDTICVGCRRQEEDAKKGAHPTFDPQSVSFHRLVEKSQTTRYHHAKALHLPISELGKHGLTAIELAERILKLPRRTADAPPHCLYCKWHFISLEDITLDRRVPANGLTARNVEWGCATCQQGKKRFTTERQIELWIRNWDRWHEHAHHVTQPLLFSARAIALPAPLVQHAPTLPPEPRRPRPLEALQLPLGRLCPRSGTWFTGEQCPKCGWFETVS